MDDTKILKPGDLILSSEDSLSSWVVQKVTNSLWSHVGVYTGDGNFISAVPFQGVCLKALTKVDRYGVYRVKGLDDNQRAQVVRFCVERVGWPYDFVQILLLGWRIFTDRLKTNAGDPYPTKYVCSELVAEAYASVGVFFGKIVDNVLPGTIAKNKDTIRIR